MNRKWRAKFLAVMTGLSLIHTISMSYPTTTYFYLTNYPLTTSFLRNIYTTYIDKAGLAITVILLILLVDEKIWGKPTASSP